MRLCRFGENRLGIVDGDRLRDVTAALDVIAPHRYPFPPGDLLIANLEKLAARAGELVKTAAPVPVDSQSLLSPVANPSKIIGAPMNYRTGQDEAAVAAALSIGLFLKANGSLAGASEGIVLRMMERQIDYEVELGVVIGKQASNVKRDEALKYVAGYAVALDITPHGKEERSLRKSCATYTVLGPWLVTADEIPDIYNLHMICRVNGEVWCDTNSNTIHWTFEQMIAHVSLDETLRPGEVLGSGTVGNGSGAERGTFLNRGDTVELEVERLGILRNTVV